jgi:hypothetical protein
VTDEVFAATTAVFSADATCPILRPNDACEVAQCADDLFASWGARAEYCRSRGVDYGRVIKNADDVRLLERSLLADDTDSATSSTSTTTRTRFKPVRTPPPPTAEQQQEQQEQQEWQEQQEQESPKAEAVADDGRVRVRIVGMSNTTFAAMMRAGRCPLCARRDHRLAMCPHLPDELRPFC